jgi:hypothetical protein
MKNKRTQRYQKIAHLYPRLIRLGWERGVLTVGRVVQWTGQCASMSRAGMGDDENQKQATASFTYMCSDRQANDGLVRHKNFGTRDDRG